MATGIPVTINKLSRSRGLSLIEVLVAVVVLAFGLLGLAGLQALGLKNNNNALFRSQATYLAQDIVDRMRVNRTSALALDYNQSMSSSAPSGSSLAKTDVSAWLGNIARELPKGDGQIACVSATRVCEITIQWDDSRGEFSTQSFVMSTEL